MKIKKLIILLKAYSINSYWMARVKININEYSDISKTTFCDGLIALFRIKYNPGYTTKK